MNEVEPNEQIYTDYKDHEHRNPTNTKFKTTVKRIRFWVAPHEDIFTEPSLYEFRQDLITLKHKDPSKRNFIVKFHLTTGVVIIRASIYKEWESKLFNSLKKRVNDLCMGEIPLHVRSNADHNYHDSDMTATKQVMNDGDALSHNDSVVILEREDDTSNSEDEMVGDRLPANSDRYANYYPINKLENAHVKLIDNRPSNIEALKMELAEIKSEVRKIPNKLYDSIKKDLNSNTKVLQDVLHQLAENEDLKNLSDDLSRVEIVAPRNTRDIRVNTHGRKLLQLITNYDMMLANGRICGDMVGNYTCCQRNCCSVVDMLIVQRDLLPIIGYFKVLPFDWYSDHAVISA